MTATPTPGPLLYCEHIFCSNGCTVRAGMCETCIRARFVDHHAALVAALRDLLNPDRNPAVADIQRDRARALLAEIDKGI